MLLCNSDQTTDNVAEQLRNDFASRLRGCISRDRQGASGNGEPQGKSSYVVEAHGESVQVLEAQSIEEMLQNVLW